MPRRTAEVREHDRQAYAEVSWPPEGAALVDALISLHHPTRRRLFDTLLADGPATVGQLAGRIGLAVGSVSHHLGVLHRSGFVGPAPELARDTRESWWRAKRRPFSWSREEFVPGSAGRQVAVLAEKANFDYHNAELASWMQNRDHYPQPWTSQGVATNTIMRATRPQMDALIERIQETVNEWRREVQESEGDDQAADRMPVRWLGYIFPVDPAAS